MKTIGLIGGMSWESSLHYYRILNETVRERLGGLHSAQSIMYSVDFAPIERMQVAGEWERAGAALAEAARLVERGGADFLVLCTNTMHIVADQIAQAVRIPLLHIADATALQIKRAGLKRIGLLGTRFTMEQAFYKERIASHGIEVRVPDVRDRETVHRVIYDELCRGEVRERSREEYHAIIEALIRDGADGIILGCTEIMMLVQPSAVRVPTFDTTAIHATAAVELALA